MFDTKLTQADVDEYNNHVEIYQQLMLVFCALHTPIRAHFYNDPEFLAWAARDDVRAMAAMIRRMHGAVWSTGDDDVQP